MLRIFQEENTAGYTLFLAGQLDLSMTDHFQSVVEPLIDQAEMELYLNMRELQYLDKTGLGIIINILKKRRKLGASVHVVDLSPKVQRIFDKTGVAKLLM